MRRKDREITDLQTQEAILQRAPLLRLGFCDAGEPYVLPFNFAYAAGQIYIHAAPKGRKLEILAANPRVCFQADCGTELRLPEDPEDACNYGMHYHCVVGWGTATVLDDPASVRPGLDLLMQKYAGRSFSYPDKAVARIVLIRIAVERMTGKQTREAWS